MSMTAREFLFGDGDAGVAAVGEALAAPAGDGWSQALARLSPTGRTSATNGLAAQAARLLDLDLGDMLVAGWRAHRGLRAAAQATVTAPGSTEVVELASHRIASTHRPYLDLVVDGNPVATVRLDLNLGFTVDALLATVRHGRIVDFQCGRCTLSAAASSGGVELARRSAQFNVPAHVSVGDGIPLLPAPVP